MTTPRRDRPVYGVDFGMTTSSLAAITGGTAPRLVTDPAIPAAKEPLIPTAVLWQQPSDTFLVGTEAVNASGSQPAMFKDQFKRAIGEKPDTYFGDQAVTLERIVAEVLAFLRRQAVDQITPEAPAKVVLAVPASFLPEQKEFMKGAADRAGFAGHSLALLPEPIAAYTYASKHAPLDDYRPTLIYDLGGSTLDCALYVPDDGSGQPQLHPDGLPRLGGADFDLAILDDLAARYPQVRQFRDSASHQSPDMQQLRRTCETIKRRLSDAVEIEERLVEVPGKPIVTLSRNRFEALIDERIRQTIDVCRKLLAEYDYTPADLQAIIPVGGSSQIPLVRTRLAELAPGIVVDVPHPERAVVLGAAVEAQDRYKHEPDQRRGGPVVFAEPATRQPAEVTGSTYPAPPKATGVVASWIFSVGWIGLLAWLAATHWSPLGRWTAGAAATICLGLMIAITPRPRGNAATLAAVTTGLLGGLGGFIGVIVYGYRAIAVRSAEWALVGWMLGVFVLAIVAAVVLGDTANAWNRAKASRKKADQNNAAAETLATQRWFGAAAHAPELFTRILTIPAVRVFDIGADDSTSFQYAVTSGTLVFLIHVAASPEARPQLDSAADKWKSDLQRVRADVKVRSLIVFPGNRVPAMSAQESMRIGAQPTSARAFTDAVGDWLAEQTTVDTVLAAPLLSASRRNVASPASPLSSIYSDISIGAMN